MAANLSMKLPLFASVCLIGAAMMLPVDVAEAARGGARASAQTSVNRPAASANRPAANANAQRGNANRGAAANSSGRSVNRNTSASRTTNVNIDVDDGCCGNGWDDNDWGDGDLDDNPVAKAALITGTVAAIGSIVRQPPANCVPVVHQEITYQQCGSTWYQPQYSGTNVQYVVVSPPY